MHRFVSHVMSKWSLSVAVLLTLANIATFARAQSADLVLVGGRIATVDPAKPTAEAIAVRGGRIVAVGTDTEIRKLIGDSTRVVELGGKFAMPGFIEGHGHFLSLGRSKMNLDLTAAESWGEIIQLVAEAAKTRKPGEWIIGRGWHQSKWTTPTEPNVEGYPVHQALSKVSPDNPVFLTHGSGHMCFANAAAMKLAGITRSTPDPDGGTILRTMLGEPTGVFRESAQGAIRFAYSQALAARPAAEVQADTLRAVELATAECLANGVTSFHDAGVSFSDVDLFRKLVDENKLKVRMWLMLRESNDKLAETMAQYRVVGYGGNRLTVRAIKRMIDGALGAHGALFLAPYNDLPEQKGLTLDSPDMLRETALLALKNDFQLCVHAIGDRANREVLDVYNQVFQSAEGNKDRRWRIEHAQHLDPADIPRFKDLNVIASMQGVHCTSDAPYVIERLGEIRARDGAYAWRSLLDAGAKVINGTDVPVESINPIASFYASVTRRLPDGTAFFPEQCMKRDEALRSYTIDGAFAAFEEDLKGSLTPGKLADIVVLSQDLLKVPDDKLPDTRVEMTIIGGEVVYETPK